MLSITVLVFIVIGLAVLFDFLNGFHDAANSIATVVITRTLTPFQAVIMAGMANFIGFFAFGHAIAKMISSGIIHMELLPDPNAKLLLLLGALFGACAWNILTWILGLPTSSSHALIGGLIGSGIAAYGHKIVVVGSMGIKAGKLAFTGIIPVVAFIFIAPLLGFIGGMFFIFLIRHLFIKVPYYHSVKLFRYLQLVSAAWYSIGHGTNDAQKMMGIISLALVCGGFSTSYDIQPWVALLCYSAIGFGTMFGGWRIVKTMGTKITKIRATEGFCAESSAAMVLMGTAHFGIPVSTTHVISGSIMGVGAVENMRAVRWATARKIMWAWVLTIPMTAICAFIMYHIINIFY